MDAGQRQLAARRLIATMKRHHQREPLSGDVRVDTLIGELRSTTDRRPSTHRGATPLILEDAALRAVIDELVADGTFSRQGHRVRLADHAPTLDPRMRQRVDRLLAGLAEAGAAPPPVSGIAARLGIPPITIEQLRSAGELVALGPGIDYPRATWEEIQQRLASMAARGPLTISRVRNELRATRRHAEAILRRRRDERRRMRGSGRSG
ncbi:MAG TPA: hypothetical protein VK600_03620 [Candidatus Saccharimonadales bacterium]|nr:hypothetical protein [Candidatus Saccharimonadales bacterium]